MDIMVYILIYLSWIVLVLGLICVLIAVLSIFVDFIKNFFLNGDIE